MHSTLSLLARLALLGASTINAAAVASLPPTTTTDTLAARHDKQPPGVPFCYCGNTFMKYDATRTYLDFCCDQAWGWVDNSAGILQRCVEPVDPAGFASCCSRIGGGEDTFDCRQTPH